MSLRNLVKSGNHSPLVSSSLSGCCQFSIVPFIDPCVRHLRLLLCRRCHCNEKMGRRRMQLSVHVKHDHLSPPPTINVLDLTRLKSTAIASCCKRRKEANDGNGKLIKSRSTDRDRKPNPLQPFPPPSFSYPLLLNFLLSPFHCYHSSSLGSIIGTARLVVPCYTSSFKNEKMILSSSLPMFYCCCWFIHRHWFMFVILQEATHWSHRPPRRGSVWCHEVTWFQPTLLLLLLSLLFNTVRAFVCV